MRIGHGYDVHRFAAARELVLGGVHIDYEKGLLGHSDADVLCHAISDALLGAAALGDIGVHFPDTDAQYKNISSILLLSHVAELISKSNMHIENIDATLVLQRPKVAVHISEMRQNIAKAVNIAVDHVSVKATTTEGLGFTGRSEGVGAHAVILLRD